MRNVWYGSVCRREAALLALVTLVSLSSAQASAPLEVYGRLPSLEDMALSPDGQKIAYVRTTGDERLVVVHEFSRPEPLTGAPVGSIKLRSIEWMDDDDLLLTVSSTETPPLGYWKGEWFRLVHMKISANHIYPVLFDIAGERTLNIVTASPMVRDTEGRTEVYLRGVHASNGFRPALFRYDVATRRMRLVATSAVSRTGWLVDEAGRVASEYRYDDERQQWTLYAHRDGHMQQVASGTAALDPPEVLGFDASGESLVVRFIEDDRVVWKPWNLKQAAWGEALGSGKSFGRVLRSGKTGRIVGGSHGVDDDQYYFFDNELQAHWDAVLRNFPADERVDLVSASDDYGRIVVRVFGSRDGYGYHLFDWYHHRIVPLAPVYQDLTRVAEVRKITFSAADGFKVPAYLTLPPGSASDARGLPLVVLPHGGPAVADSRGFDWWAQALADQGYVVLQPNYRGSDLNRKHLAAGFGEWGRKMQTDLSDGVHYLAEEGLIDPRRVCIVGGSYGGYAALAGMTLQPGTYRCGVSVAGLSDLVRMLRWSAERSGHSRSIEQRWWDRFMGVSGPDDPRLKEISPIEHVAAVQGPVLLIHGRDDTVVPYEQSEMMEKALRKAGKSVTLVDLKHEDHWLSGSATRLQMLQATVAFLKANNPVDEVAATPAAAVGSSNATRQRVAAR